MIDPPKKEIQLFSASTPSVSVSLTLKASLGFLSIDDDLWVRIGRAVLKLVSAPVTSIVMSYNHFREEVVIEMERSRARIRTASMYEITLIYQRGMRQARNCAEFDEAQRRRLVASIDRAFVQHLERIISWG